ncbi:MAG: thioredoxin domain-containing protein [Myxococcota bacterium]
MSEPNAPTSPHRRHVVAPVVLTLALVGLGTSALMLYLYLMPGAGACGPEGGCDAVRTSQYSRFAGIPLPYLGLAYFAALAAAVLVPRLRTRVVLGALAVGGVATGLTLLTLQGAVIGAWCPYCVVVDVCSLGAGLAIVPGLADPAIRLRPGPVLGAAGLGFAVPVVLLSVLHTEPEPPVIGGPAPAIAASAEAEAEGQATIVEFVDFECPFCRRQHRRLAEILDDYGDRVQVVYKHWPLRMHPHAREAARYACCAQEQGRGKAMADALFARDALTQSTCQECADQVGLDPGALQECLASERPDQQLERDDEAARQAKVRALPTCFVGEQRFEGLQKESTLRAAIDAALAKSSAPS